MLSLLVLFEEGLKLQHIAHVTRILCLLETTLLD